MPAAIERIVVQATPEDKRSIVDKARRLDLPVSELMRRSALAYEAATDADLEALADAARHAADRAGASIDDALAFIEASNRRLAVMEPGATYRVDRVTPVAHEAPAASRAAKRPSRARDKATKAPGRQLTSKPPSRGARKA